MILENEPPGSTKDPARAPREIEIKRGIIIPDDGFEGRENEDGPLGQSSEPTVKTPFSCNTEIDSRCLVSTSWKGKKH